MLGMRGLSRADPQGPSPEAAALIAQLRQRLHDQEQQLADRDRAIRQASTSD